MVETRREFGDVTGSEKRKPGEDAEDEPRKPATSDRLREDIDRGAAADKVAFLDPAAAPLGTDDEAAGTPPTREQVNRAQAAEARAAPSEQGNPADRQRSSRAWAVIAVLGLVLVAAILFVTIWTT